MSRFYRQVFRVICCGRNENVLEVTSLKIDCRKGKEEKKVIYSKTRGFESKFESKLHFQERAVFY